LSWYAITDPKDPKLDELAGMFNFHPLHVEDARNPDERPKAERTDDYLFVILKALSFTGDNEAHLSSLSMFVGIDFLITVCNDEVASSLALARAHRAGTDQKPGTLFYFIFDDLVDSYFNAIDKFSDHVDELQDRVLDAPGPAVVQEIFDHKRVLSEVRRSLVNIRDVCIYVQREAGSLIDEGLHPYFRDIYDHIIRNLDSVEMERDLLTSTLDVYLSSVANRTNEVMKVLTVVSTVALPCLVISSIYGMNVKGIPFLDSPYGMLYVALMMAATTAILLIILKKFRWL